MKKVAKWVLIISIVLLVLLIALINCGDGEEEAGEPAEEEVIDSPEALVVSVVGEESNHSEEELKDRIIDVSISGEALNIKLIGNDNFSTDYIRRGMLIDSCEIYGQVFDLSPEVNLVYIEWQFPLVDSYGNVELEPVMKIDLTRETEAKINWDNFLTDNLPDVADSYWHHPALSK